MNHWFSFLNIAGSAVLAAFGLYVWRVEPGNPRNRAFALFAVAFSLATAVDNVEQMLDLQGILLSASWVLEGIVYGLGGVGAAWFGIATVEPDRRTALTWLAVPCVLAVAATGFGTIMLALGVPLAVRVLVAMGFFAGLMGGSVFAVLLLADDFRQPDRSAARRREWAFLAAALVLYLASTSRATAPTP